MELTPRIGTISKIGKDGTQYITVYVIEPNIDSNDLWQGGFCISFDIDHKKQTTTAREFYWSRGVPVGWRETPLKKWKDEILTADECLKYAPELYEKYQSRYNQ